MELIKITNLRHIKDYLLELEFSDSCVKRYDFSQIIVFRGVAERLKEVEYFRTASIIQGGRAFGWDNDYDCCADWARYYAKDFYDEWKDYDDSIDLHQRMIIAKNSMESAMKKSA